MTLLGCTVTLQGHGEWGPPTARADQLCVALASRTTHTVPRSAAPASASPACTRIAQLSFVPRPFWSGPWGKTCGWPSLAGGAGPQKRPLLHPPPATCPEASALPDSWRVPPSPRLWLEPQVEGAGCGKALESQGQSGGWVCRHRRGKGAALWKAPYGVGIRGGIRAWNVDSFSWGHSCLF